MNEPVTWILAAAAGALLGLFFFGGLWWTIRRGLISKTPALWFLGSLLFRTAVVTAGFYFVTGGKWDRILACLPGFVIARFVILRMQRNHSAEPASSKQTDHETDYR